MLMIYLHHKLILLETWSISFGNLYCKNVEKRKVEIAMWELIMNPPIREWSRDRQSLSVLHNGTQVKLV